MDGITPNLLSACEKDDLAAFKREFDALKAGRQKQLVQTCAQKAAELSAPEVLEFCFSAGASWIDGKLFIVARTTHSTKIMDALLSGGFEPGWDFNEYTDTVYANIILKENLEMARHLVSRGATVADTNGGGIYWCPMLGRCVKKSCSPATLDFLLTNNFPLKDSFALHYAAKNNDIETIKFLLDKGADINENLSTGEKYMWRRGSETLGTPMHYAVEKRKLEAVQLLLECGADLTLKDHQGRSVRKMGDEIGSPWVELMKEYRDPKTLNLS